jgi:hypothetical protein
MRYLSLENLFRVFAVAYWTIYTASLSCIFHLLLSWEPHSGASRLLTAEAALAVITALSIFVWWAEWGLANRPRVYGLPELNTGHWIYILAIGVWVVYFTPLAFSLYWLFTWTRDTGGYRLGMSMLNLTLTYLMSTRIGRRA